LLYIDNVVLPNGDFSGIFKPICNTTPTVLLTVT